MKPERGTRAALIRGPAEVRRRLTELKAFKAEHTRQAQVDEFQRESAERYRTLVETIPHGIEEIDTSGIILVANVAHHRQYECDEGELIGMSVFDFVATDSEREEVRDYLNYLVNEQPPPTPYFGQKKTKTGRVLDVQVAWAYKRDAQGRVTGFTSVITDITEHKHAQAALRDNQAALEDSRLELQALAGRLLTAQEDERRLISRELHDDINQRLALLTLEIEVLHQKSPRSTAERLGTIRDRVVELSDDVHRLAYQLHSSILDDLGLPAALRSDVADFTRREGIKVELQQPHLTEPIPPDVASCLYRVAQEALRNVAKHAHAAHVTVSVEMVAGGIKLAVADSGVGFDTLRLQRHRSGLGVVGMQERVRLVSGRFSLTSHPGQGTRVEVWVPLPEKEV